MNIIQTKSFKIAVNTAGNPASEKLAILIPGRLDTKDYINFISHLEFLSQRGFFTVAFDHPGTWESPGDDEYTTTNYIKVVNELIEYFGNKPTLLVGHSRGGAVTALVGASNPNVIGITMINASYGPPSPPNSDEIQDGYLLEHRDIPPGDRITDEQREFHLSLDYFKDGEQYDPTTALKSFTKPKLLIHATEDEWEELDNVKDVFDIIPEPKMFYELNGKHDYRRSAKAIEEVNSVLGDFITRFIEI